MKPTGSISYLSIQMSDLIILIEHMEPSTDTSLHSFRDGEELGLLHLLLFIILYYVLGSFLMS